MFGFSDSGYLITIGASFGDVALPLALGAVVAFFVHRDAGWSWLRVGFGFGLFAAFLCAYYLGDRIVFGPAHVRETVWFREVGRVEWRHVQEAKLESREVTGDGQRWSAMHLVLALRTGDEWTLDVDGLGSVRQLRLLEFAKAQVARR